MTNQPGTYNFSIQRRSTVPLNITHKDSNGDAVNHSGYEFAAQVWNKDRTVKFADFSVEHTNRAQGKVLFKLTPSQTETFRLTELEYDIKYKQPNNDEFYLLEGIIFVSEGYTTI